MTTATAQPLTEVIRLIPGYDPYRDAEGCAFYDLDGEQHIADCWFDEDAAQHRIDFIHECVTHTEGKLSGLPFILEPWEQAIVGNVFGWKRPYLPKQRDELARIYKAGGIDTGAIEEIIEAGSRRYREIFMMVGRKNGKTPFGAAIVCAVMHTDNEPGAQIYSLASKRDQAELVHGHVKQMHRNCEEMSKRVKLFQYSITLNEDPRTSYKYVSAKEGGSHGANAHLVMDDETHTQPNRKLIEAFKTAMGARVQPLMFHMTTSDYERPDSICNELCDYSIKVRDGIIKNPAFLPVIYAMTREEAETIIETEDGDKFGWEIPERWKETANPNLGVSLSWQDMHDACDLAKNSPPALGSFLRLHLNVRTEQISSWLPMDKWHACGEGAEDPIAWRREALERLKGQTCEVAVDLGAVSDLTAVALLFRDGEEYTILPFFWCPRKSAREKDIQYGTNYIMWARDGFLELTEGIYEEVTDFPSVRVRVNELSKDYSFACERGAAPEVAVDRLFSAYEFMTGLANDGFEPIEFGQGFLSMAAPTKKFLELVINKQLRHGNNPILKAMAQVACVKTDEHNNMKIVKPNGDEVQVVDGLVSAVMALGRSMARKEEPPGWDGTVAFGSAEDIDDEWEDEECDS